MYPTAKFRKELQQGHQEIRRQGVEAAESIKRALASEKLDHVLIAKSRAALARSRERLGPPVVTEQREPEADTPRA
jgi:hypothetical protein